MSSSGKIWIFVVALVLGGYGLYSYDQNKVTCIDHPVPYTTTQRDNPNNAVGTKQVAINGVNGTNKVCDSKAKHISTNVVTSPVTAVYDVGTKQPVPVATYSAPAVQATQQRCQVTLCNDGSCSYSTGRGTCSWHGGVNTYY